MFKPFVSGVAVGIITLYSFGGLYARVTRQRPDELVLPDHWVPYVATRLFHTPHGDEIAKEYRNSRGSTATYFQPDGVGPVTIHNADTQLTYARVKANDWISFPLRVSIPPSPPTIARYKPHSVSLRPETLASLPVYEVYVGRTDSGLTKIVPGLNGLIVAMRNSDGYGDEFVDIVVQEPTPELFLPPTGVPVRRVNGPSVPPNGADIK
jgi:hypothetical protein